MGAFRLVRLLGSGTRSRVFLGHDGGRSAAVKVFRAGARPESIDDEIAALSSASHAHIVQLREVGTSPAGLPFLVLERLRHGSLAELLSSRPVLGAGEAVTVLAPIVAAVGALHSSGVAHGSLGPERVMFRETGAPVLTGLGRATLFVPPSTQAMLSTSRPVLEDRLALGRLVQSVVARVVEAGGDLPAWLAALERDGYPDGFSDLLLDRVFGLGQASPVRFGVSDPVLRVAVSQPSKQLIAENRGEDAESRPRILRTALGLVNDERVLARLRLLVDGARSVRRPVWITAVVALGSLAAALLLVPGAESGEAASVPSPSPSIDAAPRTESAVEADDPLGALAALMTERERCIRDLSVLCLENVDQSGSSALDDDVVLIRSIESGQTTGTILQPVAGTATLTERHGDAALVRFTVEADSEPASVLLVKGEAGWRIRDYLVG